jgi:serine/threonine protein phosphatase PrpC
LSALLYSTLTPETVDAKKHKKEKKDKKDKKKRELEILPPPDKSPIASFFAVYDGHGGKKASDFASQNLFGDLLLLSRSEPSLHAAVEKALAKTESDFLKLAGEVHALGGVVLRVPVTTC